MCGILACQRQFYKPSFKHQLPTVLCRIFPRSSKVPSLPETSSLVSSTLRFLLSQLLNRVVPNAQSFELVSRLQVSVISDKTASRHLESNHLQEKQVHPNQLFPAASSTRLTTTRTTPTKRAPTSTGLELGWTSIGVDTVYTPCCDFIQAQDTPIYESLRLFLKLLLDLILSQNINGDSVQ